MILASFLLSQRYLQVLSHQPVQLPSLAAVDRSNELITEMLKALPPLPVLPSNPEDFVGFLLGGCGLICCYPCMAWAVAQKRMEGAQVVRGG